MIRSVTHVVSLALFACAAFLVAGDVAAHPGHGTPHLLHEADAIGTWWIVGAVLAVAAGVLAFGKGRS